MIDAAVLSLDGEENDREDGKTLGSEQYVSKIIQQE
jgi:hypothetical protein